MAKLSVRYNARQKRRLCRVVEGVGNPFGQGKNIEQPQIQPPGQHERRQDGSNEDPRYIAELEYHARGRAVDNRPANEHEKDSRNAANSDDRTDGQRVSGQEQNEPGECDQVELITDGR